MRWVSVSVGAVREWRHALGEIDGAAVDTSAATAAVDVSEEEAGNILATRLGRGFNKPNLPFRRHTVKAMKAARVDMHLQRNLLVGKHCFHSAVHFKRVAKKWVNVAYAKKSPWKRKRGQLRHFSLPLLTFTLLLLLSS